MLFNPFLEKAVELAAQWHGGTFRKSSWRNPAFDVPPEAELRVPVMAHLTTTALTVQRAGWEDAVVAAAFLHDALEDVNQYGARLRRERLRALMGAEVMRLVVAVTEAKVDEAGQPLPWRVRKEGYAAHLREEAPAEAAAISIADKLHNLWTINQGLERGHDVFAGGGSNRGLSAGPAQQQWFHRAVLDATRRHADDRLVPMREQLEEELVRFEELAGL